MSDVSFLNTVSVQSVLTAYQMADNKKILQLFWTGHLRKSKGTSWASGAKKALCSNVK